MILALDSLLTTGQRASQSTQSVPVFCPAEKHLVSPSFGWASRHSDLVDLFVLLPNLPSCFFCDCVFFAHLSVFNCNFTVMNTRSRSRKRSKPTSTARNIRKPARSPLRIADESESGIDLEDDISPVEILTES